MITGLNASLSFSQTKTKTFFTNEDKSSQSRQNCLQTHQ